MVRVAVLLALAACEPMPSPSASVLAPVVESSSEPSLTVSGDTPAQEQELFDFDADLPEDDDEGPKLTDKQLQAKLLGQPIPPAEEPPPPAPASPTVVEVAAVEAAIEPPVAFATPELQPGQPLAASWGIRLVSTIYDADPPRAVLGFPDGHEEVVQAGALLPSEGVAVLAIGRNAVQIAEITPAGDHARVESRVIPALYPQAASITE